VASFCNYSHKYCTSNWNCKSQPRFENHFRFESV